MARPIQRTAAKDYPAQGIAKGERYWYVSIKTGPRSSRELRSKTPFKRSQLTTSEYKGTLYGIIESLEDGSVREDASAAAEAVQQAHDDLETLRDDTQDKLDNMPEGLQQGDTGNMLQERIDACEDALSTLDEIHGRLEDMADDAEGGDASEELESLDDALSEAIGALEDCDV